MDNLTQKHLFYKQFVAWSCNSCSTSPLTDYINNPAYQELIYKHEYDSARSNERIYLDLRASSGYTKEAEKLERNDSKITFKTAATKKLRLSIWAHLLGNICMFCQGKASHCSNTTTFQNDKAAHGVGSLAHRQHAQKTQTKRRIFTAEHYIKVDSQTSIGCSSCKKKMFGGKTTLPLLICLDKKFC